jgi:hypothetical protein
MPRRPPNCAASRSRSGGRETGNASRSGHAAPAPPTTRRCRRKSADGRQDARKVSLIDDLATRDVNQDCVLLHQAEFAGAAQSLGGGRHRGTDDEDIGDAQHLAEEALRSSRSVRDLDPHPLPLIDGIADTVHLTSRTTNLDTQGTATTIILVPSTQWLPVLLPPMTNQTLQVDGAGMPPSGSPGRRAAPKLVRQNLESALIRRVRTPLFGRGAA